MGPVKLNDSNIRALMNNPEIRESVLKHLKRLDAGVLHDAVIDGFFNTELPIVATYTEGASVITSKAAIHDQFKTGHTLEDVHDIGCSIPPPAAVASLF
jgi:hypothetical protein